MVDFTNLNTLAASLLVATWRHLGLEQAVLCPGSRSSPLTIAFARHGDMDCVVSLDERSAAFFALGHAKHTGLPVALVCTSGTAAANFFPAIIEAHYSQVPLLVLTGDRPPLLRNCRAGQTINQTQLYGQYPQWQTELALPELSVPYCHYLRQTAIQAWQRLWWPHGGVVHLNCPFAEPLEPRPDPAVETLAAALDQRQFFSHLSTLPQLNVPHPPAPIALPLSTSVDHNTASLPDFSQRGLILVGVMPGGETPEFLTAIVAIAQQLNWPILCDALSSVRNYADEETVIITSYDFILRNDASAKALIPDQILQIGELPTSKQLRAWLDRLNCHRYCLGYNGENLDPLHGHTIPLPHSAPMLLSALQQAAFSPTPQQSSYTHQWQKQQQQATQIITAHLAAAAWMAPVLVAQLPTLLPPQTSIFVANSLPIRWLESFWPANGDRHHIFVNRGANGIDGTLSTAMGIAHNSHHPAILLTGDLSLLHDSNGFLNQGQLRGQLTIILLNNNGGGIFEWLPIAAYGDVFERYFATPQSVDFAPLCQTYGVHYQAITDLLSLKTALSQPSPTPLQVLELKGDRRSEWHWLQALQSKFAQG